MVAVHPRAGGEHRFLGEAFRDGGGSSPRGRGTRSIVCFVQAADRFIPARAGNTDYAGRAACYLTVHPRAGGEHGMGLVRPDCYDGSSPRGRGTQNRFPHRLVPGRFIPARAGNTSPAPRTSRAASVHPRAGGEHVERAATHHRARASSPRGRGTRPPARSCTVQERFIPARAGNTMQGLPRPWPRPVHPRAGGEHEMDRIVAFVPDGSSPRGRGTQGRGKPASRRHRFIPARAGNTHGARIPPH